MVPIVRSKLSRFLKMTSLNDFSQLREALFALKCDVEADASGDTITLEVQSDRIDMMSLEGIARAVRLFMGIERPSSPRFEGVGFEVKVIPPTKRPYIAVAAVRDVELDGERLEELIEFQERLHITFGRDRRKVAVGLHALEKVRSGRLTYMEVDVDSAEMIPLGSDRAVKVRDVLKHTKQGVRYGAIAINGNLHPAILANGDIISLPPVINSELTRLEEGVRGVLIDVTGTDLNAVLAVLNAIIHALTFYGGSVVGAKILSDGGTLVTPEISWRRVIVDIGFASEWLGLDRKTVLSLAPKALERMGYMVNSVNESSIEALVPYYRADILHQVDVVEDIAIGIGYDALGWEAVPPIERPRRERAIDSIIRALREVLIGLGYVELNTITLVPSEVLQLCSRGDFAQVTNAISSELNAVRNTMLASLLIALRDSQHAPQPLKVFEVGDVVIRCEECYNLWKNKTVVAWAVMDSEIRFEDLHADLYAALIELGLEGRAKLARCDDGKLFIPGRCAVIHVDGHEVGVMGEINPEVLTRLGIRYPVAAAEVDLNELESSVAVALRQV